MPSEPARSAESVAGLNAEAVEISVIEWIATFVKDGWLADMGQHGDGWHEFRLPPSLADRYAAHNDGPEVPR